MRNVLGEDQNSSYTPGRRLPRTNLPANPRNAACTIPAVFIGSQGFSFEGTAVNFSPPLRHIRGNFVVRTSQYLRSFYTVICTPAVADLQVSHVTTKHRDTRGEHSFAKIFSDSPC